MNLTRHRHAGLPVALVCALMLPPGVARAGDDATTLAAAPTVLAAAAPGATPASPTPTPTSPTGRPASRPTPTEGAPQTGRPRSDRPSAPASAAPVVPASGILSGAGFEATRFAAIEGALTLPELIELSRRSNPGLAAARSRIDVAQAGVITATTRPNPELEVLAGRQNPLGGQGASSGATGAFGILQPLERSSLREARRSVAETGVDATRAGAGAFERDLLAELKLRYLDVLRLQAAARLAEQDLSIAEQIRSRVQVRVDTGESPRFELIRADTERLSAQRAVQAAARRIDQGRAELRRLVGVVLPADFAVAGSIEDPPAVPMPLQFMRERMLERHPELLAVRAELRNAEARVALERERRRPAFALRAGIDRVPESTDTRLGLVVSVPIFDRREGPIAEALADVERSRFAVADRELLLAQSLDSAWQRYEIAGVQVAAYESGILREAEAALRVAEAAYRFGERGILDFLDAQRTFRTVRNELNTTRYELRAALVELERLRAESE